MQDRTRSRARPAEAIEEDDILTDGFVAKLADQVFENPAMSGGLFVMALTAAAIVSNAMMMQNGRHPDPFFMTRPSPVAEAPVPLPRVRVGEVARSPAPVPLPRLAPPPAAPAAPVAEPRVVAEIQRVLAVKKLYAGAADGIAGSRTRAAISAYEKSAGMPVTGTATADLLARLKAPAKQASAKPSAAAKSAVARVAVADAPASPPPAARVAVPAGARAAPPVAPAAPLPAPAAVERQAAEPTPAVETAEPAPPVVAAEPAAPAPPPPARVALVPAAEEPLPPPAPATAEPAPIAEPPVPRPGPDPALIERQHYRSIQNALNQAGYGPLPIDGVASEETAGAIRRFELDNGLPLTGKPGDRVTARLVAIGAMAAN